MSSTRKTPDLAESNAINYLQQIFKVPAVTRCRDFDEAIDCVLQNVENAPLGFECSPIFWPERFNVRSVLWNLTKKSQLAQNIAEGIEDCGYFILADSTLVGKHSLMLCACGFASAETAAEDVSYHVQKWSAGAGHVPRITTASVPWNESEHLFIAALQLSSYV